MQRRSLHLVSLLISLAVFCAAMAIASPAQIFTMLVNFDVTNGANPDSPLIQGSDGNFYGTTSYGGSYNMGTIFKLTPAGTLTTLLSFSGTNGAYPHAGLVLAKDGNFYGTTSLGGGHGWGTVFKITPLGTLTTLHSFNISDGNYAQALVQGTDGNLYGTTYGGGTSNNCTNFGTSGCGTVFKITLAGTLTTLHSFVKSDGQGPLAGLVQGTDGNFYGTTFYGGTSSIGTVFSITPAGTLTSLHSFDGRDGANPEAGLVQGTDGNLYGTAFYGTGYGTVFKITPEYPYTLTTLHTFSGADGANPEGLIQATDGYFYGTTDGGGTSNNCASFGSNGCGTIFKLTPAGTLTTLQSFDATDGANPEVALLQASNGIFYGTTWAGGTGGNCSSTHGCGTVFSLSLGPTPPVQFVSATPCRVVDTRNPNGTFGGPSIPGGTFRSFPVPQGACDIPSTAAAYSLNVTVVPPGPLGYLTIWPTGENKPYVSTLNSYDGRVKANAAIVPAGAQGAVSVYVSDTTDVVLDIDGYFEPVSNSTLAFYTLTPCRVADTRGAPGDLGAPYLTGGVPRDFQVLEASSCNIPDTAKAYSLNFTAVPRGPLGYLSVWPTRQSQPYVSTLNSYSGQVVANAAIVPSGTSGKVSTYASNDTDLVIDINGYFAPAGQNGLSLYPVAPCRVLDTRLVGNGQPFSGTLAVDVLGSLCAPPSQAQAYVFNATVVPSGFLGFLALWPDGGSLPVVSTLNSWDGAVTSNMAIVPAGTGGKIDAYASDLTQLILDISSYFAP